MRQLIPLLLAATLPALPCTDRLINLSVASVNQARAAAGSAVRLVVPVTATAYDGSNGGPVSWNVFSSIASVAVQSFAFNVTYGSQQAGTVEFQLRLNDPTISSTTLSLTPRCGPFGGATVSLLVNFTGEVPIASVPTWGHNTFTAAHSEPISMATGELFESFPADLSLGGPLPLSFERHYAAFLVPNDITSALGRNWMHNFDHRIRFAAAPNAVQTATVILFPGKAVVFNRSGLAWQLANAERFPYQLLSVANGLRFLDPESRLFFNFNAAGALTGIEDRNANAHTVTPGPNNGPPIQVIDGLGRSLTFTYSGNFLSRVRDHAGRELNFSHTDGNLTAFTDADGKRTTFAYTSSNNNSGLLTATTRPVGNRPFTQAFDPQARVAQQEDSFANRMTIQYNTAQNGAVITEPGGLTQTFLHDSNLNLIFRSSGASVPSRYAYDAAARLTSTTNRLASQSFLTYDASGFPASTSDPIARRTAFRYSSTINSGFQVYDLAGLTLPGDATFAFARDDRGNLSTLTDPSGARWQATANPRGLPLTLTNPAGGVTTLAYSPDANLTSLQLPSGETMNFSWNNAGQLTQIAFPGNANRSFSYNARGQLTRAANERNQATSFTYDDNANLRIISDPLSANHSLTYDTNDRLVSLTDPLGRTARFAYDNLGRLATSTDPSGLALRFAYNSTNHLSSITDPSTRGLSFTRNAEGWLASATDPLNRSLSFTRDAAGQVVRLTGPANESYSYTYTPRGLLATLTDQLNRVSSFTYDARGGLTAASLPGAVTARYVRNEFGHVASISDPNRATWLRAYDSSGRLRGLTDPLSRSTSLTYNDRQRVSEVTFPTGSVLLTYDAANRLTARSFSDGLVEPFTHDAAGRLTSARGAIFRYDAAGQLTNSNGLALTYDAAGRLASVTYAPNRTLRYSYNNRGLLVSVNDWIGGAIGFLYDDAAQLTAINFPNGVAETYTLDPNGRLLTSRIARGDATLAAISLQRDGLGRVTASQRSGVALPDPASGVSSFAYDAAAQDATATYDALGRVTASGGRTYRWNLAGNLLSYSGPDGEASFTYDAFGQRLTRSGLATVWNYATTLPSPAIFRNAATDADLTYNLFLPDGTLIASIDATSGARRFYHFDESGNTLLLTGSDGAVTDTFAISPFGESISRTGSTPTPFTFHGLYGLMEEPAAGLFYARARYYDANSARFLSKDPISSLDPRLLNPYQFAFGNPLRYADPTGLSPDDADEVALIRPIDAGITESVGGLNSTGLFDRLRRVPRSPVVLRSLHETMPKATPTQPDFVANPSITRVSPDDLSRLSLPSSSAALSADRLLRGLAEGSSLLPPLGAEDAVDSFLNQLRFAVSTSAPHTRPVFPSSSETPHTANAFVPRFVFFYNSARSAFDLYPLAPHVPFAPPPSAAPGREGLSLEDARVLGRRSSF